MDRGRERWRDRGTEGGREEDSRKKEKKRENSAMLGSYTAPVSWF